MRCGLAEKTRVPYSVGALIGEVLQLEAVPLTIRQTPHIVWCCRVRVAEVLLLASQWEDLPTLLAVSAAGGDYVPSAS